MNEVPNYYNPYAAYAPQMRPMPRQVETPYYGTNVQNYIKGRPVVSIDEARAAQIDLDGSLYVFTDIPNKKIYTKQIGQDGSATFKVYELNENDGAIPSYVTREEFNKALTQINDAFNRVAAQRSQSNVAESSAARKPEFQI